MLPSLPVPSTPFRAALQLTLTVTGSLLLATLKHLEAHDAAERAAVRLRAWDLRLRAWGRR